MKNRKKTAGITAGILAAAILLTGTFAWQSISQQAKNEIIHTVNPGGRLHDDFNGEDKNIYVENFMSIAEGGQPIFARVRLDEYLEYGENAGDPSATSGRNILVPSTDINDVTTWITHKPNADDPTLETGSNGFHNFWEWEMGGQTVFMPTFNKNVDSLSADVNGTWKGKDGVPFKDFTKWEADDTLKANAYYDMDDDTNDEYDPDNPAGHVPGGGGADGTDYYTKEETHTAQKTLTSTVMTMKEWKKQGCPMGPIWVYDDDGWAYWAQAIKPGEATGPLLSKITYIKGDNTPCYYGVNVVGQFATADECAVPEGAAADADPCDYVFDKTKAGLDKPSPDARVLLKQAMGIKYSVEVTADGGATEVAKGGELAFTAVVKADGTALKGAAAAVEWTVTGAESPNTKIDKTTGKLTVGADETAAALTVQAKTWTRDTDTATVNVVEAAPAGGGESGGAGGGGEEPAPAADEPGGAPEIATDPTGEEPTVVDEPTVDEPVVDEPIVDEPTVDEPAVGEPTVDEPAVIDPEAETAPEAVTEPELGPAPEPAAAA